jgi:5-methylcytosine-specific restriction enzyme subunit McrC
LKYFDKEQIKQLIQRQNKLLHTFEAVSEDISYFQIKRLKVNSLYKEYVEAIRLAKEIMKKFGYSFANAQNEEKQRELAPFWIDMSKLFELYVYSLLKDIGGNCKIEYQQGTREQITDFLFVSENEKIILDTKYKLKYNNDYEIDDIRQISAYARTKKIREKIHITDDEKVVECVIIYPNLHSPEDFKNRVLKEKPIEKFTKFYKCGIKLPLKETARKQN